MNLLLEINPNEKLDFFKALTYGGQTVLIGMATIFAVLIIIWAALTLLKIFLYDIPNNKKSKAAAVSEPVAPAPVAPTDNGDEIIAVIAAAIAMAESESGGAKFRVVSFKRK